MKDEPVGPDEVPDEELERWLRSEVVEAAKQLDAGVTDLITADEIRQHLTRRGTAMTDDLDPLDPGMPGELALVLNRLSPPGHRAPEEWIGKHLLVTTEAGSRHELDLTDWWIRRVRGRDDQPDPEVAPASELRRDGEQLGLLAVIDLEIGRPAVLILRPLREGAWWTRRITTYVTDIKDLDPPDVHD